MNRHAERPFSTGAYAVMLVLGAVLWLTEKVVELPGVLYQKAAGWMDDAVEAVGWRGAPELPRRREPAAGDLPPTPAPQRARPPAPRGGATHGE